MKYQISKGIQKTAIRLAAYGPEGIGKSTFASQFPEPLFLDCEGGTNQLDVARFPKPEKWTELLDMIDAVIAEPEICRTLVIDTADRAESLLTTALLEEGGVDSIEKYGGGYGKGYTALAERFNKDLLMRLDRVIAKGVNVVVLAHAAMRKLESPDEPPYDRWELKTSKKVAPLIKEWTDILVFMNYEVKVVEENGRNKAKGTAKRKMYFNHAPTHDAKNRFGLADGQDLSFEPLAEIYEGHVARQPEKTEMNIDAPVDGIIEGDNLEDPRDVLVRRLSEQGITALELETWLVATGRLQPGSHYTDLSGTAAKAMEENIETLVKQIKKGGKKKK